MSSSNKTCPVCCDDFTGTVRQPITCAHCQNTVCARCVKTYLLSTPTEPHCMNCRHFWDRSFLADNLTHSWCEGDLRRHREVILFDRERSLLPATQNSVEEEREKRAVAATIPEIANEVAALRKRLEAAEERLATARHIVRHGRVSEPKERRQFVAACPLGSCRGFLSTAYKCGTCEVQFCPACREVRADDTHQCDPGLVETMKAIAKDSRPCPSCGMPISRVSGCDQMFCTQCDTAFSYNTGKKIVGVIHNPHYFERMRVLNNGEAPQVCGGWPNWYQMPVQVTLNKIWRRINQTARHIEQEVIREVPTVDNTDLRVRYLLNEIDERTFKQQIQQRDRRQQRLTEIHAVLQLYVVTTLEVFIDIDRNKQKYSGSKADDLLQRHCAFIENMINAPLRAIGDRYRNAVPQIHYNDAKKPYNPTGYKPVRGTKPQSNTSDDSV